MMNCSNVSFCGKSDSFLKRARKECLINNLAEMVVNPKRYFSKKVTQQEYAEAHKKLAEARDAIARATINIKK